MTRPDPRLLVPVSALPFVPEGARVWGGVAGSARIAIGDRRRGMVLCDTEPDGSARDVRCFDRSPTMLLDASAPELRDGLPVRLDALPWLLRVLHPDAESACDGSFDPSFKSPPRWILRGHDRIGRVYLLAPGSCPAGAPSITIDPWPDLTNLTPDDAARAVVVAAVVARGAQ